MSISIIEENLNNIFVKNTFDEDLINFIKIIKYKEAYCQVVFKIMGKTPTHFIDILPYSYKKTNYLNLLKFLTEFLIDVSHRINNSDNLLFDMNKVKITNIRCMIVRYLCKTNKAQYLLKRLAQNDPYFNDYFLKDLENNMTTAANSGTLPTFLFCLKYLKEDSINYRLLILDSFISSNRNSDSRLYEYFLKKSKLLEIIRKKIESDSNYLFSILNNLGYSINNTKYFLKRMKTLDKFLNLKPYVNSFHNTFNIEKLIPLLPYYVNNSYFNIMDSNTMINIIDYFDSSSNWVGMENQDIITKEKFYKSVEKFNSVEALQNFKLLIDYEFKDETFYNPVFIRNFIENSNFPFRLILSDKFRKVFVNTFRKNPVFIREPKIMLLLVAGGIESKYDRHLNILRRFFGRILNIQYKTKYYLSRFNLKTIENDNFTTIPPKHMFSNDINGNVILRPKADGTLVSSINRDVYPTGILSNYIIKAEYIPKLDLYLVFDINLPNTNSIDRYIFLRNLHPATCKYTQPYKFSNLNDIIKINKTEDSLLSTFLDETVGKRWYPKATFEGHLSKLEYGVLLNHSSDSKKYHNSIYLTDGFIIHNNQKEFKLKPYDMMTIDIKYDFSKKNWYDREGNNMNDYIDMNELIRHQMSTIWRCYPIMQQSGVKFVPKEIREDKRRANPNKIIRQIVDYLESLQVKYYQKSKRPSLSNLTIIKRQSKRFDSIIRKYNIINKSWLDLGCGKGKLLKSLKNMMIYFGIDIDRKIISRNRCNFSDNKRVIFKNADVANDKMDTIIPPLKFDYIVMNHSINHFYGENLLKLLNESTKPGSIIIFNITNDNLRNKRVSIENGFIENKESVTKYKFPWTHNRIVTEKYISEAELKRDLNNFEIVEENIYRETEFESIYSWYVMRKCN